MPLNVFGAPMGPWDPWDQYQQKNEKSIFHDFFDAVQSFAYKRYFNTISGPWHLPRIIDNGLLYILIQYNVF